MVFSVKKGPGMSWLEKAKSERTSITVDDPKIMDKLKMLDLTVSDLQLLKTLQPFVKKEINQIAKDFYSSFYQIDELREIIDRYSSVEKLSQTLAVHVMDFFSGVIDDSFLERRVRVGKMHYKIALTPSYYMGTFQNLQSSLVQIVFRLTVEPAAAERMICAINKMISLEQQIVLEVYEAEYAENLKKEYEEGREDLRSAIRQVSSDLTQLSAQTHDSVHDLLNHFSHVRETVHQSSEEAERAKGQASGGKIQLKQLFSQVNDASRSVREMGEMVQNLESSSQEIGRVTGLVKDISEQTNILALNSAIEAARAGEYGKGFTIVSQEIRKLAEETNKAMAQISDLTAHSADVTVNVVGSLTKTTAIIEKGMAESKQTGQKFEDIIKSVDKNSALSGEIDQYMDVMAGVAEKLGQGTETLTDAANQLMEKL
ncbi:globin-coupled sensor protein [Sporolactobacillus pectinivorans]|uniref:globin-coupled sensor protein n=1 Tax=Sporolactobacillus pectinivorans TaxID=1591408 RepID=UPI000C267741|nr:globin-coupled sensor protein [Sporolactobacillus pectinivorans]